MPKTKKRTRSFVVTLDLPQGVGAGDMRDYIRQAIHFKIGGMDPDMAITHLDRDSVRMKIMPQPKEK